VFEVALAVYLQDWREWRKENFVTVNGREQPNAANSFEGDKTWLEECDFRIGFEVLSRQKLGALQQMQAQARGGFVAA
jgi:hypothetical protein